MSIGFLTCKGFSGLNGIKKIGTNNGRREGCSI